MSRKHDVPADEPVPPHVAALLRTLRPVESDRPTTGEDAALVAFHEAFGARAPQGVPAARTRRRLVVAGAVVAASVVAGGAAAAATGRLPPVAQEVVHGWFADLGISVPRGVPASPAVPTNDVAPGGEGQLPVPPVPDLDEQDRPGDEATDDGDQRRLGGVDARSPQHRPSGDPTAHRDAAPDDTTRRDGNAPGPVPTTPAPAPPADVPEQRSGTQSAPPAPSTPAPAPTKQSPGSATEREEPMSGWEIGASAERREPEYAVGDAATGAAPAP